MASGCVPNDVERSAPRRCGDCGATGRAVRLITLKALLRPGALERLTTGDHYYCGSAPCSVVYFGKNAVFRQEDVLVPVFQKGAEGVRTVCYCLDIGEDQIRGEIEAAGVSASAERIKRLVQRDQCACEVRNPQGTCCLGNIAVVGRSVQGACVT